MSAWLGWRRAFRIRARTRRAHDGVALEQVASLETLAEAWSRVRSNHGGPGGDGVTIAELAPDIEAVLRQLSASLLDESYRPRRIRRACIPKPGGGRRPLAIPSVVDRIAQTAAMLALEPDFDRRMSESSLAYRAGRGVPQAVAAVASAYAAGLCWTVDADIESFFDRIRHRHLMPELAIWIDDERILRLLWRWLGTFSRRWRGVAQGAPISPLLANAYLHPVDRLMAAKGHRMVRYADDFVILAPSASEASRGLADVEGLLRGRGLALNGRKTRIAAPGEDVRFLGHILRAPATAPASLPGVACFTSPVPQSARASRTHARSPETRTCPSR